MVGSTQLTGLIWTEFFGGGGGGGAGFLNKTVKPYQLVYKCY